MLIFLGFYRNNEISVLGVMLYPGGILQRLLFEICWFPVNYLTGFKVFKARKSYKICDLNRLN